MDAYIAQVPLHLILAMQMVKQNNIRDCDLYYIPTSNNADRLVERVKKLGIFNKVVMLPNISIEYPITIKQILAISKRRFEVRKILKNQKYETIYYNSDGWLLNSIIFSSLPKKKTKNIFVENGLNPYITPYDSKEWYLRLFINMNFMTCMDGRFIDERYLFEPSLMAVSQSGRIKTIDKLDKTDVELKKNINKIFNYDDTLDSFKDKKIIIMEQGPRKEAIDMQKLWGKVKELIDYKQAVVKSHPRQKESTLKSLGFDMYERYMIPWEVLTFNQDMGDKTLFSIFSTACVNPKLMYDEEPRVIMLYKLIEIDYSFFGKGMIDYVEEVGKLYSDKSKFFIPESWDELKQYCIENNLI